MSACMQALAVLGDHRIHWWVSNAVQVGREIRVRVEVRAHDDIHVLTAGLPASPRSPRSLSAEYADHLAAIRVVDERFAEVLPGCGGRVLSCLGNGFELAFPETASVKRVLGEVFSAPLFEHKEKWTSPKMTLTEAHTMVAQALVKSGRAQCTEVFANRRGATFCVKRAGHAGDHRGWRKQWNATGLVPITEKAPE